MTTPLIPLKSVLSSTKYTPADLIADRATELWLLRLAQRDGLELISNIMSYYREGATSYTHVFATRDDALIANTTFTAYGYDVTGPSSSPDKTVIISWV
jgi:hypothetical protein